MLDPGPINEALRSIPDPEMPISIVDLGLIERVDFVPVDSRSGVAGGDVHVVIDLLPTFIGCPALDMIANDIRAKLGALPGVASVKINWLFDPPWSVDRITPEGRASLKAHGVTVPTSHTIIENGSHSRFAGPGCGSSARQFVGGVQLRTSAVPCPFCGSSSTYLDSPFGPTRCRSIYYCEACKNSFEHMKRVASAAE